MKTKTPRYPQHMRGKSCGYELLDADGTMRIAAVHYQTMEDARVQRAALEAILDSVTRQCHTLMTHIVANERRFWDGVQDDYELDTKNFEYSYVYGDHALTRKPKAKPTPEERE